MFKDKLDSKFIIASIIVPILGALLTAGLGQSSNRSSGIGNCNNSNFDVDGNSVNINCGNNIDHKP
jgi:hypothetical protein